MGGASQPTNEPDLASRFFAHRNEKRHFPRLPTIPFQSAAEGTREDRAQVTPGSERVKHIPYPTNLLVYSGPATVSGPGPVVA
jgi:hypothetical protein